MRAPFTHVMSRGNGKAAVFHNDVDRRSFVQTLAEACAKTDWQVHAYWLVKTHFHLLVETPLSNLVPGMKWLLSTYTIRFRRKENESNNTKVRPLSRNNAVGLKPPFVN